MRTASTVFKVLMWIVLFIYLAFQALAVIGLLDNNNNYNVGRSSQYYNIIPLVCASMLMLTAAILFIVLKKHRYIGLIIGIVAAGMMLVIALDLGRVFSANKVTADYVTGLTTKKLFINHIGISLVPILMIPAWVCERIDNKNNKMILSMKGKIGYNFTDEIIFTDVDDNGRITEKTEAPHRLKRSLQKKKKQP